MQHRLPAAMAVALALMHGAHAQQQQQQQQQDPSMVLAATLISACPFAAYSCALVDAVNMPTSQLFVDSLNCLLSYPAELLAPGCVQQQQPLLDSLEQAPARFVQLPVDYNKVQAEVQPAIRACPATVFDCAVAEALASNDAATVEEAFSCFITTDAQFVPAACAAPLRALQEALAPGPVAVPDQDKILSDVQDKCFTATRLCALPTALESGEKEFALSALQCLASFPTQFLSSECQSAQRPMMAMLPEPVQRNLPPYVDARSMPTPELQQIVAACPALTYVCQLGPAMQSAMPALFSQSISCLVGAQPEDLEDQCKAVVQESQDKAARELQAALDGAASACPQPTHLCGVLEAFDNPDPVFKLPALKCLAEFPAQFVSAQCMEASATFAAMLPVPVQRLTPPALDMSLVPADLQPVAQACPELVFFCGLQPSLLAQDQAFLAQSVECLLGAHPDYTPPVCQAKVDAAVALAQARVAEQMDNMDPASQPTQPPQPAQPEEDSQLTPEQLKKQKKKEARRRRKEAAAEAEAAAKAEAMASVGKDDTADVAGLKATDSGASSTSLSVAAGLAVLAVSLVVA